MNQLGRLPVPSSSQRIAIVGAGFSGTLQAINLLRYSGNEVILIEQREAFAGSRLLHRQPLSSFERARRQHERAAQPPRALRRVTEPRGAGIGELCGPGGLRPIPLRAASRDGCGLGRAPEAASRQGPLCPGGRTAPNSNRKEGRRSGRISSCWRSATCRRRMSLLWQVSPYRRAAMFPIHGRRMPRPACRRTIPC